MSDPQLLCSRRVPSLLCPREASRIVCAERQRGCKGAIPACPEDLITYKSASTGAKYLPVTRSTLDPWYPPRRHDSPLDVGPLRSCPTTGRRRDCFPNNGDSSPDVRSGGKLIETNSASERLALREERIRFVSREHTVCSSYWVSWSPLSLLSYY